MTIKELQSQIISCRRCSRLVKWREAIAQEKVRRFSECNYWGKPVPSFGDTNAELLIVGLAPAAHGGNRTGRLFTGDRSGDWLVRSLYKAGFANQSISIMKKDGLKLNNCYITAVCRCAPPQNKLLSTEISNCKPFLQKEFELLKKVRVICTLGKVAFENAISLLNETRISLNKTKPKFGHGMEYEINDRIILIASYHPSQQNTFTRRLTEPMFNDIFKKINKLLEKR